MSLVLAQEFCQVSLVLIQSQVQWSIAVVGLGIDIRAPDQKEKRHVHGTIRRRIVQWRQATQFLRLEVGSIGQQ